MDTGGGARQVKRRERLLGIALMCAAVLCFSGIDASAKFLNQSLHPVFVTWIRYVVSVALISLFLNPVATPRLMRTSRLGLQSIRSVLLFASTILNFLALQYLQLTETISIQFSTPLLVALLAGPLLGEWVGRKRLIAVAVGFCGVLIITRPGLGGMHPAALLCLLSSVCYSLYNIITRVLARHDSAATTLVYSGLAGLILITPAVPLVWTVPTQPIVWIAMVAIGVFGSVGHGLLILAHARAPAPVLAPFIYTQILWSITLGYVMFGDLPDRWTLIGGTVVILSGLYLILRERPPLPPAEAAADRPG